MPPYFKHAFGMGRRWVVLEAKGFCMHLTWVGLGTWGKRVLYAFDMGGVGYLRQKGSVCIWHGRGWVLEAKDMGGRWVLKAKGFYMHLIWAGDGYLRQKGSVCIWYGWKMGTLGKRVLYAYFQNAFDIFWGLVCYLFVVLQYLLFFDCFSSTLWYLSIHHI